MALSLSLILQEWISQNITDRLAFAAADWCFCLHGWPIMPPLFGVYVFTDRPPRPPPTGVSACTAGLLCHRCWAYTSSPTDRLVHRRLVFPPARLAFMPPLLGDYVFTDRHASAAADWCFRLHDWPIMPPSVGRPRLHRPAASSAAD